MKYLIAVTLLLGAGAALAATLMSQTVEGKYRQCTYSDGRVIAVPDYSVCPSSIND